MMLLMFASRLGNPYYKTYDKPKHKGQTQRTIKIIKVIKVSIILKKEHMDCERRMELKIKMK